MLAIETAYNAGDAEISDNILRCPECKSIRLIKSGKGWSGRTRVQRYQCKDCGRMVLVPIGVVK